ncbi:MAG: exodeoxyribonuclease III [Candidatus Altiarchaeota archaeon]|nr:exodeoxyribonuclease III [Candidatus Altiarchaeota archaeon]
MKLISWNVNGFRASVRNGFYEFLKAQDPDVLCLQEIKMHEVPQIPLEFSEYFLVWNPADKKGYSGTATFSKKRPLSVKKGMGEKKFDSEGRMITTEFEDFYVVNNYFPNSQRTLARLGFKLEFNQHFAKFVNKLKKKKPVLICGDLNVAHTEIDIARPKENAKNAGFTPQEREWMTDFLSQGYVDSFRHLHPQTKDKYSWWSYMHNARKRNIGWRIDYFIVSENFADNLKTAFILEDVTGSDHAPVGIKIK